MFERSGNDLEAFNCPGCPYPLFIIIIIINSHVENLAV